MINNSYEQNIYSVYDNINVTEHDVLRIEELKSMLNNYFKSNDYEIKVIKLILNFLKNENIKNRIYFKLAKDKYHNLIALYFNIDSFIEKGVENIWLFTNSKLNGRTFLQMSLWNKDTEFIKPFRNNVAHVYINEFRSFYPRMGHGSYILKNLDYIIYEINKLISLYHESLYPIKSITGIIVPMTRIIKYEDLVRLYTANGFSTLNQKKTNGSYKTIIIKQHSI